MGLRKRKRILLFLVVASLVMMLNVILFYIRTMLKRLGLYHVTKEQNDTMVQFFLIKNTHVLETICLI